VSEVTIINLPNHVSGNTFAGYQFNATDESGVSYSLTGATPTIVFRYGSASGTIVSTMAIGTGLEWVDQSLGKFKISRQVISWAVGKYFYECAIVLADTTDTTPFRGSFSITIENNT
jgi:hypothetical protein